VKFDKLTEAYMKVIENTNPDYKIFKVPKRLWKKIDSANGMIEWKKEVWEDVWKAIDEAMPNLPKGEKSEIIDNVDGWCIKVTAPMNTEESKEGVKKFFKNNTTLDACPRCGAEERNYSPNPSWAGGVHYFICGTTITGFKTMEEQGELCRKREAHKKGRGAISRNG
jgi:hypothetical protein